MSNRLGIVHGIALALLTVGVAVPRRRAPTGW